MEQREKAALEERERAAAAAKAEEEQERANRLATEQAAAAEAAEKAAAERAAAQAKLGDGVDVGTDLDSLWDDPDFMAAADDQGDIDFDSCEPWSVEDGAARQAA